MQGCVVQYCLCCGRVVSLELGGGIAGHLRGQSYTQHPSSLQVDFVHWMDSLRVHSRQSLHSELGDCMPCRSSKLNGRVLVRCTRLVPVYDNPQLPGHMCGCAGACVMCLIVIVSWYVAALVVRWSGSFWANFLLALRAVL